MHLAEISKPNPRLEYIFNQATILGNYKTTEKVYPFSEKFQSLKLFIFIKRELLIA